MWTNEKLRDRIDLFTKYWNIVCTMNFGSMTGGYHDSHMMDRIMVAIEEYENAKVTYQEKWSKNSG